MGMVDLGTMRLWALLISILLATSATALKCFRPLAGLAEDAPEVPALIQGTYRQLWEKLGLKHLTPGELEQVAQKDDPFLERENIPHRLDVLKVQLKKFRGLLEQKGWNTPANRTALIEELQKLAAPQVKAAETQRSVMKDNRLDTWEVSVGSLNLSPDGRWSLSGRRHPMRASDALTILDTSTGKGTDHPWPTRWDSATIHFVPDGQSILVGTYGGTEFYRVPVNNGVPDVTNAAAITFAKPGFVAKLLGKKMEERISDVQPMSDPNFLRIKLQGGHVYNLDLKTGATTFLEGVPGKRYLELAEIPGQKRYYTIGYTNEGKYSLKMGAIDPDGKLGPTAVFREWDESGADGDAPTIQWSRDGEAALCYHFDPPLRLVERSEAVDISQPLLAGKPPATANDKRRIRFAFFSADGKKVGAVMGSWNGGHQLYWYDRATKTWAPDSHGVTAPGPASFRLTPDGRNLLYGIADGPTMLLPLTPELQ